MIVSLTVTPVNDAPVITSPATAEATVNELFNYLASAVDPDGTPVITFEDYASWMNVSGDNIIGMPPVGATDTSFVIIASDGELADTLQVAVTVYSGCDYGIGDVNGSGGLNGLDVTYSVAFFKGGPPPTIECNCGTHGVIFVQGDVNATCAFNGLDVTYLVTYFKGGAAPMPCPDCPPIADVSITKVRNFINSQE
jgi:hypothetical protein